MLIRQLAGVFEWLWLRVRRLWWRKTLDDLSEELAAGKSPTIDEFELARWYTKHRMPQGLRYPRKGDVYEAIEDTEVGYMTAHMAPYTGGGKALLPRGERVRVSSVSGPEPIGVYCDPLRYHELHEQIVPPDERSHPYYDSYYFHIHTVDLNRRFRLVASGDPSGR